MPSRKCPDCGKIVSCNFKPEYCSTCGTPLKNEPLLSYEEIIDILNKTVWHKKEIISVGQASPDKECRQNNNNERETKCQIQQMKLF